MREEWGNSRSCYVEKAMLSSKLVPGVSRLCYPNVGTGQGSQGCSTPPPIV